MIVHVARCIMHYRPLQVLPLSAGGALLVEDAVCGQESWSRKRTTNTELLHSAVVGAAQVFHNTDLRADSRKRHVFSGIHQAGFDMERRTPTARGGPFCGGADLCGLRRTGSAADRLRGAHTSEERRQRQRQREHRAPSVAPPVRRKGMEGEEEMEKNLPPALQFEKYCV